MKNGKYNAKELMKIAQYQQNLSMTRGLELERLYKKLDLATRLIRRFIKWFDHVSESEGWENIVKDAQDFLQGTN